MTDRDRRQRLAIVAALAILGAVVFGQAVFHPFVSYDDDRYITGNAIVQRGLTLEGLRWAFTTTHASNWHPLTWISHMADVTLFGVDPRGHHLVNVLLHLLNGVLLFRILEKTTGDLLPSAFTAALFLVHPLHVEPVAWVAERKELLGTLFGFLAILAYAGYARAPRFSGYIPVFLLFAASLLSKPMLVTLPFLLLLLDVWPLRRIRPFEDVGAGEGRRRFLPYWEKAPLLLLSLGSSVVTLYAQGRGDSIMSAERFPLGERLANGAVSYAVYLGKMAYPASPAVFYPLDPASLSTVQTILAGAFLLLVTGGVLLALRPFPFLAVGWFWYLGTLVPVIGIVQVGMQSMADRYVYVPLVGPFVMVAWGVRELLSRREGGRRAAAVFAGGAILALSVAAGVQLRHWRSDEALFTQAASVTRSNWIAHHNLAVGLARAGRDAEAALHFEEALKVRPWYLEANEGYARVLGRLGRDEEALLHFRTALAAEPKDPDLHNGIGVVLGRLSRYGEAEKHFREALALRGDSPDALNNLGTLLVLQGREGEAVEYFRKALALRPGDERFRRNLAVAAEKSGRGGEGRQGAGTTTSR